MQKAAFLKGIRDFHVGEDSQTNEESSVRIKVDCCAICGSDIRIFNYGNNRVKYPAIIGHEVSGTVVKSNNSDYPVGEKLSLGADIPCGECPECKKLKPNLCKQNLAIGYQLKGGFAEYMDLSDKIFQNGPLVKLGDLDLEIGCLGEPLACAINGIDKVHMMSGARVLIYGAGPIGIMLGFIAKLIYKAETVDFVEVNSFRRENLKKLNLFDCIFGESFFSNPNKEIERSYNYVFTACSVFETHKSGIQMLANGGTINFFGGLPQPSPALELVTNDLHYRELTLTGSHGSTPAQHRKAIEIIEKNQNFFKLLVTHRFSLEDIDEAFKFASTGKGIKILIKP